MKKILGSVTTVAIGVAELRNRGYGTGHGATSTRVGLHARLSLQAQVPLFNGDGSRQDLRCE